MDKEEDSYSSATNTAAGMTTFANLDHLHREYHHPQQQYQQQPSGPVASSSSSLIVAHHEGYFSHGVHHHDSTDRVAHDDGDNNNNNISHETANMVAAGDYMLSHSSPTALKPPPLDRLSFADVMQFADFGPKLALNHHHYHHQQLLPPINKAVNHADDEEQFQEEIDPINHNPRNIGRGHYDNNNNMDPHVYFLKFPVLGDRPQDSRHEKQEEEVELHQLIHGELGGESYHDQHGAGGGHGSNIFMSAAAAEDVGNNNNNNNPANAALVDFQLLGENNNRNIRDLDDHKSPSAAAAINTITTTTAAHDTGDPMIAIIKNMSTSSNNNNNVKRKRPRSVKTSEEVESQRMTHIAVERNRRKQMNEHLRVLRSLMPTSYVQRGDQASIIGGAIEFVRELEQLLQCLESQKRRRLYGTADHQAAAASGGVIIGQQLPPRPLGDVVEDPSSSLQGIQQQHEQQQQQQHPPIFLQLPPMLPPPPYSASGTADLNNPQGHQQQAANLVDLDIMSTTGSCMREETAESKSSIADVEVKMLGFDALIKILSRRRPGQLIKVIAALEDLQFNILHTNITTIEQTVLYSFNVKVASESVFTAEEIASSVQHIFTFIHANTNTA